MNSNVFIVKTKKLYTGDSPSQYSFKISTCESVLFVALTENMSAELAMVPTIILTFIIGGLISSGSRRCFGKTLALTTKQYLLRCSLVVSVILGTAFSLSQEDLLGTFLDQKFLVLVTLASSIAMDHFYGFKYPDEIKSTLLDGLAASIIAKGLENHEAAFESQDYAWVSSPLKFPPAAKGLEPSSGPKPPPSLLDGANNSTLYESGEGAEYSELPGFEDKAKNALLKKERKYADSDSCLFDDSFAPIDSTGKTKKLPDQFRNLCKSEITPICEDNVSHFSVPPAAFNERSDHQCMHVHLKEPAKLHIVPRKEKKGMKKFTFAPKQLEQGPDFEKSAEGRNYLADGMPTFSVEKQFDAGSVSAPTYYQTMGSFLGSVCVVGSMILLEEQYCLTSFLVRTGEKYLDKPVLAGLSVAIPFFLYCLTFFDNSSGFSVSRTLVVPTDDVPKRKNSKRDSACTCVSQTGLIYLGVLCIVVLAFLGFMMEYFPRRPPPPPKFYETCTGKLLIVTFVLLLMSLGVIAYLCTKKPPRQKAQKATKSTASGTASVKRPQKNFSYVGSGSSVHRKSLWSLSNPCLAFYMKNKQ